MAGAKWLGKTAVNTLEGLIPGAAIGALGNPDEPWQGAVLGGLPGAAGGAATGVGSRVAKMAGSALIDHLFTNQLNPKKVRAKSLREYGHVLDNDAQTTDQLRQELTRLGPGSGTTLADVGDENALARAAAVATMPGGPRKDALTALRARAADRPNRVLSLVQRYLTPNLDASAAYKTLQDQKRRDADAKYGDTLTPGGQDITLTDAALNPLLDRLHAVGAFKKAGNIAQAEGIAPPAPLAKADPANNLPGKYALTARQHDLVVRGLGDRINTAYRKGDTTLGRSLVDLKHAYLAELYPRLPGYEDARKTFSDYSTSQGAIDAGREFDSRKWRLEDLVHYYSGLDPGDQDFFRLGQGERVKDLVNDTNTGHNAIKTFFGSPNQRTKLAATFRDPASSDAFTAGLHDEMNQAVTENKLLGGSPTQPKLAEAQARGMDNPDVVMRILDTPQGFWSGLAKVGLESLGHDPAEMGKLSAQDMTKILLNPKLHENLGLLDNLDRYRKTQRVKKMIGSVVEHGLATAGGAAAGAASLVGRPDDQPDPNASAPLDAAPDPALSPDSLGLRPSGYSGGGRVSRDVHSTDARPYDLPSLRSVADLPPEDPPPLADFDHPYTADADLHSYYDLPDRAPSEGPLHVDPYVEGQKPKLVHEGTFGADTYRGPNGEEMDVDPSNYALPFSDELDAALSSVGDPNGFSNGYDRRLKVVRGGMDDYAGRHPYRSGVASLAGLIPGLEAAPAKLAAAAAKSPLMRSLIARALSGAGYGAVYGFDEGEGGFTERAKSAARGALAGGALGGATTAAKPLLRGSKRLGAKLVEMGLE